MASTTTFGEFPGVRVETAGGAITGVAIGREEKLVYIGEADLGGGPNQGSANANEATQINSRLDADRQFGTDSELSNMLKDALANGANIDFLYGVAYETSSSSENFTAETGTLSNQPIVEDDSSTGTGNEGSGTITVTDNNGPGDLTLDFRYDVPPSSPSAQDEVHINPITGQFDINSSSTGDDYDIEYSYPDWDSAMDEAVAVIGVDETGILAKLTENDYSASGTSEAEDLSTRVNDLRADYKMALGLQAAQPNDNSSDNDAFYDTQAYSDGIDNDAMFLHAPARKEDSQRLVTGALGGLMAGNTLSNPIYDDELDLSENLEQRLSLAEANDLRDVEVIPIRQPPQGGSIVVADNLSTSQDTTWDRDFFTRRIVDQVILISKSIGDSIIGRINDEETRATAEERIQTELRNLANDRLIESNEGTTASSPSWFVDVYEIDRNTVGIDIGVTPLGIVERVDTTITINT